MENKYIDINFAHDSITYTGWITPSNKLNHEGKPKSYHVVLNDVFFGNVSQVNMHWQNDEDRPQHLTDGVGKIINTLEANADTGKNKL